MAIEPNLTIHTPCDECGRMITAEIQKGHTYYRCTKKNIICKQPYIREEELDRQLSSLLQKFSLRPDWAAQLNKMLEKDRKESAQSATAFVQESETKVKTITVKLQRLLDGYLEQDIEREVYLEKKRNFMSEKKSLEEQITNFEQKRTGWLEPRFGQSRGAPARAERRGFVRGKPVGRASRVPPFGFEKAVEFCIGVFIKPYQNLFSKSK